MWDTGLAKILRNTDPMRLPEDKRERWTFAPGTWGEMSEDARRRWREWFDWATSEGGELWDANQKCANLIAAPLDGVVLARARLGGALMERTTLRGCDLTQTDLRRADLRSAHMGDAILNRALMQRCDLSNARLSNAVFTGADLSEAVMHHTDLTQVDFKDARLFGTRITDPTWWVTLPRATRTGGTVFQRGIPEHPIQDVMGLPPLLRRQIADVQFLRDMHRKAGPFGRGVMWFWGVTCQYGQSIGRWAAFSALVWVFFAMLFMFTPLQMNTHHITHHMNQDAADSLMGTPDFGRAMYMSVSTLMTLGIGDEVPVTGFGRFVTGIEVTTGYLMLGGLLSILANKMARLS